jgi:hypothetical protein
VPIEVLAGPVIGMVVQGSAGVSTSAVVVAGHMSAMLRNGVMR